MNASSGIEVYMQGQNTRHTEDANTWQTMEGIFQIDPDATKIRLFLQQASQGGDPPDGTRAMFDDLELRVFDTQAGAESYRDNTYNPNHPIQVETIQNPNQWYTITSMNNGRYGFGIEVYNGKI